MENNKFIEKLKGNCIICKKEDFLISKMCKKCYNLSLIINKKHSTWKEVREVNGKEKE